VMARTSTATGHGVGPDERGRLRGAARCGTEAGVLSRGLRGVAPALFASWRRRHGSCSIRIARPRTSDAEVGPLVVQRRLHERGHGPTPARRAPLDPRGSLLQIPCVIDYESVRTAHPRR
jgi:hypothetical protein